MGEELHASKPEQEEAARAAMSSTPPFGGGNPFASPPKAAAGTHAAAPNWPPFYPLISYDVANAIPLNNQGLIGRSFLIWQRKSTAARAPLTTAADGEAPPPCIVTTACYLVNVLVMVALLFAGLPEYASVPGVVFAALYAVIFPVLAFMSWHFSLYRALQ